MAGAIFLGVVAYQGMAVTGKEQVALIRDKIEAMGGSIPAGGIMVVPPEESPFESSGKGNTIYKITYTKDGKTQTAWYRSENHSSIIKQPEAWILPN